MNKFYLTSNTPTLTHNYQVISLNIAVKTPFKLPTSINSISNSNKDFQKS